MNLRELSDAVVELTVEGSTYEVLVSNNPAQHDPSILLGRVVVLPATGNVTLIRHNADPEREKDKIVMQTLVQQLLGEVQAECTSDGQACSAIIDQFEKSVPEIDGEVLANSVVCPRATSGPCPSGIR